MGQEQNVAARGLAIKSRALLLSSSFAASLLFLVARPFTAGDGPVFFKVASIVLLMLLGFRVNVLLGSALAFSAAGDVLLGVRRIGSLGEESLFLLGLVSFLLAHLVYILLFGKHVSVEFVKRNPLRVAGAGVILVALGGMLVFLRNSLGPMLVPVAVYALVLSAMGISAMLADLGTPLAAIGALLFIASDAMLATSRFHGAFPTGNQLIWISYYLAQLFLLRGVETQRGSKSSHPS
jgi:uncharacterized membrane protein YhhN